MDLVEGLLDTQTKFWRLRRSELLSCLSDAEVREMGSLCRIRVVERGSMVFETGEPSDRVFIVESGVVKLSRIADDGREVNVAVLGPMDLFGELALSGEGARMEAAGALEDSVVCGFECSALEGFLLEHPELAMRVTKLIGERLRRAEVRIQDILFKDVRTRLAHTVVRLANKFGEETPDGTRIGMRLTQTDLADLIGSTRETTSTIFNEFRRDGLVGNDGHYILVHNVSDLSTY